MGIEVRRVESAAELERLAGYRYRVYVEELGLLDASAADAARRRLVDDLDDVSTSYAVFDGERVVGSLRLTHLPAVGEPGTLVEKFRLEEAIASFGAAAICTTSRFIVEESVRRSRAMLRMMELCYEDARRLGVRLNYGDTSPGLLLFYEHMGYRRYTRPWNDPVYGFKLPILMVGRDPEWFRRVRSPLLRVALRWPPDDEAHEWFEATYGAAVACESAPFHAPRGFVAGVEALLGHALPGLPGLLHELTAGEVEALLSKASLFDVRAGDRLLRSGERVGGLLIVARGQLSLEAADGGRETLVAGDALGDVGGRFVRRPDSEVAAAAEASLLVLPTAQLEHLLAAQDEPSERLRDRLGALLGSGQRPKRGWSNVRHEPATRSRRGGVR